MAIFHEGIFLGSISLTDFATWLHNATYKISEK